MVEPRCAALNQIGCILETKFILNKMAAIGIAALKQKQITDDLCFGSAHEKIDV